MFVCFVLFCFVFPSENERTRVATNKHMHLGQYTIAYKRIMKQYTFMVSYEVLMKAETTKQLRPKREMKLAYRIPYISFTQDTTCNRLRTVKKYAKPKLEEN